MTTLENASQLAVFIAGNAFRGDDTAGVSVQATEMAANLWNGKALYCRVVRGVPRVDLESADDRIPNGDFLQFSVGLMLSHAYNITTRVRRDSIVSTVEWWVGEPFDLEISSV